MICSLISECEGEKLQKKKEVLVDSKGCKSKFIIENENERGYYKIDFENCVYKGNSIDKKCDYGIKTENTIFYIELKGVDFESGYKQLINTIEETKKCFQGLDIKARLVLSKSPAIKSIKNNRRLKVIKRLTNKDFISKNYKITENI